MSAGKPSERDLLDSAIESLKRRLPSTWRVEAQSSPADSEAADVVIGGPNNTGQTLLFVEVKSDVAPKDVEALLGGPWRRWRRQMGNQPILLVAPYIGPRVRELLTQENVSYLDLTGNTRINLDYPSIFIETQGANQDPRSSKARTTIRGAKAGAVIRLLADVAPPYTGVDIARAAKVNEGYLSRILDALDEEGLVYRERSGPVTQVDWPTLLRRRAQSTDLFRRTNTFRYVARQGLPDILDRLRKMQLSNSKPPTVTGSFAAAKLAPIAAPTLLVIYSMNPRELEANFELLPADTGADLVLIRPENDVVFARSTTDGGIAWAAPSQVAIDCLSGTGRMPAEGEALINWMLEHEVQWRLPSIRKQLPGSSLVENF